MRIKVLRTILALAALHGAAASAKGPDDEGLYKLKCRVCHDRPGEYAPRELVIRDGQLQSRYTSRGMSTFLAGHGRLEGKEIARMVRMLTEKVQPRKP